MELEVDMVIEGLRQDAMLIVLKGHLVRCNHFIYDVSKLVDQEVQIMERNPEKAKSEDNF